MEVSSYGGAATESSGLVRILKDLSASIADEDVLIVEDIIDTGLTLNYLIRYLRGKNPASLRICTLLDKPARRLVEIPVDYTGFTIPDSSSSATAWTTASSTATCATSASSSPRSTPEAGRVTMQRRPLGRGRTLAAMAGLAIVVGCVLPWWTVGGTSGHPGRERQRPRRQRHRRVPRRDRRRWPSSRCPTRPATGRWASTAGCRSPSWRRRAGWRSWSGSRS